MVGTTVTAEIIGPDTNEAPTIEWIYPTHLSDVSGSPVILSADAIDPDGDISKVEFYADGEKIGNVVYPPYELFWLPEKVGDFVLEAIAYDDESKSTSTETQTVSVLSISPEELPPVTHSTADLGWTTDEDVGEKLKTLLSTLQPGDHLRIDDMYKLTASRGLPIPENTVLSAVKGGGFTMTDTELGETANVFTAKEGSRISNVSFYHSNVNDTEYRDDLPINQKKGYNRVTMDLRGDNIVIENCHFNGNITHHLKFRSSNHKITLRNNIFYEGYYQVNLNGSVKNILVDNCYFTDSAGDGIKTVKGDVAASNITVRNSYFDKMSRDGIDTTGGFNESVVKNSYFLNSGSAFDVKTIYDRESDKHTDHTNKNLYVSDCVFVNLQNVFVLTTIDRYDRLGEPDFVNDSNADRYLTQGFHVSDSTVYESRPGKRFAHIKDAHTVSWDNIHFYVNQMHESRIYGLRETVPSNPHYLYRPLLSKTNYNITKGEVFWNDYIDPVIDYPFDEVGPQ